MTQKPNLIFDAGGVLVFPDFDLLADIANRVGIETSRSEIAEKHARLFRALDEYIVRHHKFPNIQYFLDIFKQVTDSAEKTQAAYELTLQADKVRHIWTTTQPWVRKSIHKLKELGYQMAVISNSDGRVDQILQDLDLREYFEIVIDSFVVGVEKPDSRIFKIALKQLSWDPSETIYIGDIFYIDVWGANQAGLGAVHLDIMGLYDDWEGIHIPSIKELPHLLTKMDGNLKEWDLFPAQGFKLN
jgi:putative hydrolase of the HAD superfamily